MSGLQPVAVFMMKVPAGDHMVPAVPEFAAMFRLSMAAIDPSAEPELVDGEEKKPPRATLKMVRFDEDDSDSDESDEDLINGEDDDSESSDGDEVNGGPSDPAKSKKGSKIDIAKLAEDEGSDDEADESDEEMTAQAALMRVMKGKNKASGDDDDLDDLDFEDDDDDSLMWDETVVCTLDPEKVMFTSPYWRQPC